MSPMWAYTVLLGLVVTCYANSSEFGRNPQHDFGSVVGSKKMRSILPFWTMLGDAFANEDFIRLTPDRQSKRGAVWNTQALIWNNWEIMMQVNVNGISQMGADGLAFWLGKEVNVLGDFFGFVEQFHGIGVIIDTYDNDGSGQHPLVSLLQNDGTKKYEHSHSGGEHHASSMELGTCSFSPRNQRQNTFIKITYSYQTITVQFKLASSNTWTDCTVAHNVAIESGLYMGLSAATGHLADNHDVYGFTIRNLDEDATYFDSESKFAHFSKYTVAESLGRIQADIRGAMFSENNKPASRQPPSFSSLKNELSQELVALKNEISAVSFALRGDSPAPAYAPPEHTDGGLVEGKLEKKVGELVGPFEEEVKNLRRVSGEMTRNIGDLSSETKKLSQIENSLDFIIGTIEIKDKEKRAKRREKLREEGGGILSILFNILFFGMIVVCCYLGFTLYRITSAGKGGLLRGV